MSTQYGSNTHAIQFGFGGLNYAGLTLEGVDIDISPELKFFKGEDGEINQASRSNVKTEYKITAMVKATGYTAPTDTMAFDGATYLVQSMSQKLQPGDEPQKVDISLIGYAGLDLS